MATSLSRSPDTPGSAPLHPAPRISFNFLPAWEEALKEAFTFVNRIIVHSDRPYGGEDALCTRLSRALYDAGIAYRFCPSCCDPIYNDPFGQGACVSCATAEESEAVE
ncbi:MAG: hypothetical protein KY468_16270 [Armatimonadetes bacterium]|nr:hypothetical protein [Armatimonadota bacterium]